MKKSFIAAAVITTLAATCLTSAAFAQTYVGIGGGASKTDTNETSWKLYGGFQFDPTWGLELGYTDLGRYRGSNVESWSLAGTGKLPLSDTWSLLGKLGATSNRTHFSGDSNRTELLAGLGIAYQFTKATSIRLEYEDFGKLSNTNTGNNSRGSNWGLSLKYGF